MPIGGTSYLLQAGDPSPVDHEEYSASRNSATTSFTQISDLASTTSLNTQFQAQERRYKMPCSPILHPESKTTHERGRLKRYLYSHKNPQHYTTSPKSLTHLLDLPCTRADRLQSATKIVRNSRNQVPSISVGANNRAYNPSTTQVRKNH